MFKKILILSVFGFWLSPFASYAQEQLTITTYYPSPYGSYNELRTNQMSIGSGYVGAGLSNGRLLVEGSAGIGTNNPSGKLTVKQPGNGWDDGIDIERPASTNRYQLTHDTDGRLLFGYNNSTIMSLNNATVNIATASGYGDSRFSIYGSSGNDDATLTTAKEDGTTNPVFSILPWDSQVYLSVGIYLSDGAWVQHSDDNNNQLFVLDPGGGTRWYASSTGTPSWNVANNIQLWNESGTWVGPSSRTLKENFTPFDQNDILGKIDRLEVTRWNFKSEGKSITHIGPVAEDFYRIFGTGDSEKNLATIDSVGVSLAGVKALINQIKMQQQQIEKLQEETRELKSLLKKE